MEAGKLHHDVIALLEETVEGGQPLLQNGNGGRTNSRPLPTLPEIRERFRQELGQLSDSHKAIRDPELYPVTTQPGLAWPQKPLENVWPARSIAWLNPPGPPARILVNLETNSGKISQVNLR